MIEFSRSLNFINSTYPWSLPEECIFTANISLKNELDKRREEIKAIDRTLVELLAKRMEFAKKIGEIKNQLGYPVRNFQVERQVFERVSNLALSYDISADFVTGIFEQIVLEAVTIQQNLPQSMTNSAETKQILIIGGGGRMGKWLTRFFSSSGHSVRSVDPKFPATETNFTKIPTDLDEFDIIAISTPLDAIGNTVEEVLLKRPKGLVFDIASLKTEIIKKLASLDLDPNLKFVSVHPMFGPTTVNLRNRNLIVCRVNSEQAVKEFNELFHETSVNLVEIPIEEHDKLMGYSLNLVHLINILMADMLAVNDFTYSELKKFASTTFNKQIQTTFEVANENPNLYWAIQHYNAYREPLFKELRQSVEKIHSSVLSENPKKFTQIMETTRKYFKT